MSNGTHTFEEPKVSLRLLVEFLLFGVQELLDLAAGTTAEVVIRR